VHVRDVMTPVVFTADEDALVGDVGRAMLSKHIHRIIVTRNGKISGIITSIDMMRVLLEHPATANDLPHEGSD